MSPHRNPSTPQRNSSTGAGLHGTELGWVCRIPQSALLDLAADPRLAGRSRVLMALLAKLYDNFERDKGVAGASLSYLAGQTNLNVRTVRDVLGDLRQSALLVDVAAPAGLPKTMRIQGAPRTPTVRPVHPGVDGAHTSGENDPPHRAPRTPTAPWVDGAHTTHERREEESFEESLRAAAPSTRKDVDRVCEAFVASLEQRDVRKQTVTKAWRDAARLMIDRDGRSVEVILDVIGWLTTDEFWSSNILSLPKLREKFDQLHLKSRRRVKQGGPSLADMADRLETAEPLLARGSSG